MVICGLIVSVIFLLLAACSSPAEQLNQEGNQAFTEQAYLEALELYQSAQLESPELAEPYFNAANTYYRQGDYPTALEQMQMALQHVDEDTLAESSFYNMGNSYFNSQELATSCGMVPDLCIQSLISSLSNLPFSISTSSVFLTSSA